MSIGAYARVERERRFLASTAPTTGVTAVRLVTDRYVDGTRLRLRRMHREDAAEPDALKLTQKLPGEPWGTLTTCYLTEAEHAVLDALAGRLVVKRRISVPPFGYDVFHGALSGLVLAEVEFAEDDAAAAFAPPSGLVEVTHDARFTGGRLAAGDPDDALKAASEFLRGR